MGGQAVRTIGAGILSIPAWAGPTAPMMQVDKAYHENLTVEKIDRILDKLRES